MRCLILSVLAIIGGATSKAQADDAPPKLTYEQSNCRYRSNADQNRYGWTYVTTPGLSPNLDREACLNTQRSMILLGITSKDSVKHSTEIADEGSVEFRPPGGEEIVRCSYRVQQHQKLSERLFLFVHDLLTLPTGDFNQYQKLVAPLEDEMRAVVYIECAMS